MAARNVTETAEIVSQRLRLRRYTAADAPRLREVLERSAADLARTLPVADHAPELEVLAGELDVIDREDRQTFGVYTREGDVLVGTVGLEATDEPHVWSLWYWLDVEQRGQGYATEAAGALARHAMRGLGALRVEIYCDEENERSRLVPQRLGFRQTGRARQQAGGPFLERYTIADSPAAAARARAAWAPLARYLSDHLETSQPSASGVKIDWRSDFGAVLVDVSVASACDRPWLVISAEVGPADHMSATQALAHNATLAAGALVLVEDRYFLRHAVALDGTPGWKLRQCVELVGNEAIRLAVPPERPTPEGALGNYAD